MSEFDLEKNDELKAIEFSKLTVGEIYSLSQWMINESNHGLNRFKPQTDEYLHEEIPSAPVGRQV